MWGLATIALAVACSSNAGLGADAAIPPTPDAAGANDAPSMGTPDAPPLVAGFSVLTTSGGRVDWSATNQQIAFDRREASGCYQLHLMSIDGAPIDCASCASTDLPARNVGQPAWHASGRYLVAQVEQASHPGSACGVAANPGVGIYSDLWIVDFLTAHAYPIVTIPTSLDNAVLHPHFSADGTQLSWGQMVSRPTATPGQEFGLWQLEVADVVNTAGTISLANTRAYTPNGSRWYENHGFSPDGTTLIFTSSEDGLDVHTHANIYTMNLASGAIVRQLTTDGYNEHGQFAPDGTHVAWMHGANLATATEWWLMDPDGSAKRQVSSLGDPASAEYQGQAMIAADLSWVTPTRFIGTAHAAVQPTSEPIFRFDLSP